MPASDPAGWHFGGRGTTCLSNYTVRTGVSEGLGLASAAKITISENIASAGGAIQASDNCAGVNGFTTDVGAADELKCNDISGKISVTMTAIANAVKFTLTPASVATADTFMYVPAECRNSSST